MLVVSKRKEKLRFGDAFILLQIWDSGAHGHLGSFLGFVTCFLHYLLPVFMI